MHSYVQCRHDAFSPNIVVEERGKEWSDDMTIVFRRILLMALALTLRCEYPSISNHQALDFRTPLDYLLLHLGMDIHSGDKDFHVGYVLYWPYLTPVNDGSGAPGSAKHGPLIKLQNHVSHWTTSSLTLPSIQSSTIY